MGYNSINLLLYLLHVKTFMKPKTYDDQERGTKVHQ